MDIEKKLENFLDENGRLKAFPVKRKMKIYSLIFFADKFESGKSYAESEVNDIINEHSTFNDAATIRRELCSYGFMRRKKDCTQYRCEEKKPTAEELGIGENE